MSLVKDIPHTDHDSAPSFRTYSGGKRSDNGAGCTAAFAIADLADRATVPAALAAMYVPAGIACRESRTQSCAEVATGKQSILAGPSSRIITDSVFDRLVALASAQGVVAKPKSKTRRRPTSSNNKSRRRTNI